MFERKMTHESQGTPVFMLLCTSIRRTQNPATIFENTSLLQMLDEHLHVVVNC